MKNILIVTMILALLGLVGCGGGGNEQSPQPVGKTTATLKINLTGTLPPSTFISGASFTITLPASVTPAMINGAVAPGVVSDSGTFAGSTLSQTVYTAATATDPGTLMVILANSAAPGVTQVGEVATITFQLTDGVMPTIADFAVSEAGVIDADVYSTINGMGVRVASVTLQ